MRRAAASALILLVSFFAGCTTTQPTPRQVNLKIDGQWHEVTDGSVLEYRDARTGRFHPLVITAPTAAELQAARKWIQ